MGDKELQAPTMQTAGSEAGVKASSGATAPPAQPGAIVAAANSLIAKWAADPEHPDVRAEVASARHDPGRGQVVDENKDGKPDQRVRNLSANENKKGSAELDRRVSSGSKEFFGSEGSGDWGVLAKERTLTDRMNHYMWTRVALVAESGGLTNAARHMRHYLGNSGNPLIVSVDNMLRDVENFRLWHAYWLQIAQMEASNKFWELPGDDKCTPTSHAFNLQGARSASAYCTKGDSQDWFFAVGGFTHWYTASVQSTPGGNSADKGGEANLRIQFRMHMKDRYNWDSGKAIDILGLTVTDAQLGHLHRVGLAREFDLSGVSSPVEINIKTNATEFAAAKPVTQPRDGTRTDVTRKRGRFE